MQNPDYVLYLLAPVGAARRASRKAAREHFHELDADADALRDAWPSGASPTATGEAGDLETARKRATRRCCRRRTTRRRAGGGALPHRRGAGSATQDGRRDGRAAASGARSTSSEPLHPLAERGAGASSTETKAPPITAEERIARAKILTNNRAWPRALEELALVPGDAPQAVRDEADYWIGTTKFKMRRDYDIAAQKLLGVWPRLPGDERKAEALFHGARAWSRADQGRRGASTGYRELVQRLSALASSRRRPRSSSAGSTSTAATTRRRSRRSRRRSSATARRSSATTRAGTSAFRAGSSGDIKGALADFEQLAKHVGRARRAARAPTGAARALDTLGREDEAKAVWRALVDEYPFTYYALQARARLKEQGVELGPFGDGPQRLGAAARRRSTSSWRDDPLIVRVDELLLAGLTVEAGVELRRGEGELMQALRRARARCRCCSIATCAATTSIARTSWPRRYSGGALRLDPHSDANARNWWELVYPRAYREFVEKYAPTGDNPPYYLYTIMQKESAYNPHDVSYADAIGLLQMIPPTQPTGGAAHRRALHRRRALRSRGQHPLRRLVHRPPARRSSRGRSRSAPAATTPDRAR